MNAAADGAAAAADAKPAAAKKPAAARQVGAGEACSIRQAQPGRPQAESPCPAVPRAQSPGTCCTALNLFSIGRCSCRGKRKTAAAAASEGGADGAAAAEAGAAAGELGKQPADWRERMAQRQRFWSTSHGFKMGRKLGDGVQAGVRVNVLSR